MEISEYYTLTPEQREKTIRYMAQHSINSYEALKKVAKVIDIAGIRAVSPHNRIVFVQLLRDVPHCKIL